MGFIWICALGWGKSPRPIRLVIICAVVASSLTAIFPPPAARPENICRCAAHRLEKHPAHTFGDNRYSGRTFAHGNLPTTRGATGAGAVSDFQASEARPWGLFGFAPWVGGKAHGPYVW